MLTRLFRNLRKPRLSQRPSETIGAEKLMELLQVGFNALERREPDAALGVAIQILNVDPLQSQAIILKGLCLIALERAEEAFPILRELVIRIPEVSMAWNALGEAAYRTRKYDLMLDCFNESLEINPGQFDLEIRLADFLLTRKRYQEARKHCECAIALNPVAAAYMNLSSALYYIGRADLAYDALKFTLKLDPDLDCAYRSIFTVSLYLFPRPDEVNRDIYAAYLAHARRTSTLISYDHKQLVAAKERIKVAYVSSDFRGHPITRNMLPILQNHDKLRFEIHAYADVEQPDIVTTHCEHLVDNWHDIHGLDNAAVASMIKRDGIDIVVILAAKFDKNRPELCMYGAAPIHVSLHDASTSGLDKMDYLITDITMSPKTTPEWFSERLIRLPTFYLHNPIEGAPECGPLPAETRKHISFGSCNNPAKLNPGVYALWAQVLKAVPNSRLILKFFSRFKEPDVREPCIATFLEHGIDESRLTFLDDDNDTQSHLTIYQQIDIALDSYPFNGSTTTFETLWMGVPVITLAGETMVSRWSTSMLRRIGHPEFSARDEDEFVEIAKGLAGNVARLKELRSTLRDQVRQSPLCDARRRARQMERVYQYMWDKWLSTQTPAAEVEPGAKSLTARDPIPDMTAVVSMANAGRQGPAAAMLEAMLARPQPFDLVTAKKLNDLAAKLMDNQNLFLAARALREIHKQYPTMPEVLCNLGSVLALAGHYNEALKFFANAEKIAPDDPYVLRNYAATLRQMWRFDAADQRLSHWVEIDPNSLAARLDIARLKRESGKLQEAMEHANIALAIAPNNVDVLVVLAEIQRHMGNPEDSADYCRQALALSPQHHGAQLEISRAYLTQGRFSEAWPMYESRLTQLKRMLDFPEWRGEPLRGRTLLVYGEQGLSEQILFASCLPDILGVADHMVIDCEPRLASLFARSFERAKVLGSPSYGIPTWLSKAPPIDCQIPIGSLPSLYRKEVRDFPKRGAYLRADPLRIETWQGKIARLGSGLKVGLAWQHTDEESGTRAASTLSAWQPLLSVPGCRFISLQQSRDKQDNLELLRPEAGLIDWTDNLVDIEEIAALIASLDLVIAACGTIAQLAGALGKQVWVLTSAAPSWVYSPMGNSLAWHSTARAFRQSADLSWENTLDTVAATLRQEAAIRAQANSSGSVAEGR